MDKISKKEEKKIENQILRKVIEIATQSKDSRSVLSAVDMYWKYKGKYPKQESKIIGFFEKIGELQKKDKKDDRPRDTSEENQLPASSGPTEGAPMPE